MAESTLLALLTAVSMLCAISMAAFAYRLNEKWASYYEKFADLLDEQNDMMMKMNREWYEVYMKMVDMKAEAAENERD